jgi:hypothetical protein
MVKRKTMKPKPAPKPKRGSDQDLFSISGASVALNRTRRTVSRAMHNIKPEVTRSGLGLWRMQTIVDALNRSQVPILTNKGDTSRLAAEASTAYAEYEAAAEAMEALKTVAARRAAAHKLVPLVDAVVATMRSRDVHDGLHPEHAALRANAVWRLALKCCQLHCNWPNSEVWHAFNHEAEDEEAA